MKTYKIYLIRCFYTNGNIEGRYIGHTDEELCAQAILAAKKMKRENDYPPADAVFTSPLKRSLESAGIFYPENNPVVMRDLIECNFGEFEAKTAKELENDEQFALWLQGDRDTAPPFGESSGAFTKRVCESFVKIVDAMISTGVDKAAIVTHAGVLMSILSVFGLPEAPMHEWQMQPGRGFTLNIMPSLWQRSKKAEVFGELPFSKEIEEEENN